MGFKPLHLLILLSFNVLALHMAMAKARKVPTLDWVLKETNYTRLCSTKKILTINGMFPGPTLHLYKGDRIKVNVHNQADYGVTLHWHGVKQPRNSWSDGPDNIAQCAIKPQANYTYEIILSDEEGTIWWHAHSDWSRATVYGAIIVKPKPPNKYPFKKPEGEVSLILGSWYKADVMEVITEALASGGETNKSDAFTINGQPGDTEPCSSEGMFRMKVDHGKTYLLRLVNGVLNENMFFMVANHKLTVVGMDGAYIKPIVTNYIMITPGQTMDILIKANQRRSYYYIASRAFGELVYSNATTTALIQYTGNYKPPTNASFPDLPDYNASMRSVAFTRRLRSLATKKYPIDVPKTIQKRLIMTIGLNTLPCGKGNETCSGPNGDRLSSTLNNITFADPKIDVLQAYYKKIKSVFKPDFPSKPENPYNYIEDPMLNTNTTMSDKNGTRIKFLEYNTTIEIVFQGTNALNGSETHPMHVHGYSFYVVGSAPAQIFDEVKSPKGYNLFDPPLVNTIGVPKNGWTAIRFRADNPGVWYMHCHLERHTSWGMSTVLIVKNGPTRATSLRAPHYINPC